MSSSYVQRLVSVSISVATFTSGFSSANAEAPPSPAPAPVAQTAPAPPPQDASSESMDVPAESRLFTNFFIGGGAGASYGVGPGLTGMTAISGGIRRSPFVFVFETQILWGGWRKPAEVTQVEWNGLIVPFALCYERSGWMGCGVYASARLKAKGFRGDREATSTLTYPAENQSWFSTAGVRAGYELRLTTSIYVRAYVDVLKTLSMPNLHGGGAPLWQVSPLVGSVGLHLFYTLGYDHGRKPIFN
ncbi:hypothetical protein [Polyangium fumosum]|uniref:Outer membrane protein beta-barrel domain-containing protein n=1 Tax=Polyangium fumosum TaxID=889272 RepID=A0A4U1IJQ8_9BACT|nr:hypothetical protein [Polyangium fumosum]TKC94157.1 hypothetical protein E8A74_48525 [Polyangium fumosum]